MARRLRIEQRCPELVVQVFDPQTFVGVPLPSLQALFAASELAVRIAVPDIVGVAASCRGMREVHVELRRHVQVDLGRQEAEVHRMGHLDEDIALEELEAAHQAGPSAKPCWRSRLHEVPGSLRTKCQ